VGEAGAGAGVGETGAGRLPLEPEVGQAGEGAGVGEAGAYFRSLFSSP